jgi:hypothetical protein
MFLLQKLLYTDTYFTILPFHLSEDADYSILDTIWHFNTLTNNGGGEKKIQFTAVPASVVQWCTKSGTLMGFDFIKMDLQEIGWEGVDWIHAAQNRAWHWALVNMVICLGVP